MSLPYALQLYSVRDLYRQDFEKCIEKVAQIGYSGVECFGEPTLPAEQVKAALARHGLTLVGWHLGIDLLEGDSQAKTIDYLLTTGCPRAIVPWMPPETFRTAESTLAFAERMTAVQKALAPHGIALGYHNHDAEFMPLPDGALPWALLMDQTSLIAQLDNGNALSSKTPGLDTAELVLRWPGRATTVHAKPYSAHKGYLTMIGEDDIDWPAFLSAAEKVGGAAWIIVEYEEETLYEQFEGATLCLRAIEKVQY